MRSRVCLAATLSLLAVLPNVVDARRIGLPRRGHRRRSDAGAFAVYPILARPSSHSYPEWGAAWWQWALSMPATGHPLAQTGEVDCSLGQPDGSKVWFLGATIGADVSVSRSCAIPANTALFFPIFSAECSDVEEEAWSGFTPAERATCAANHVDGASVFLTLDGQSIPIEDHRVPVEDFEYTVIEDDINGAAQVARGRVDTTAVGGADGWYALLKPLSPGAHTLHFGGSLADSSVDVTYTLQVLP